MPSLKNYIPNHGPAINRIATTGIWPVWKNSIRQAIKFTPVTRKMAHRIWNKARKWEQRTHEKGKHGGIFGRSTLSVLYSLLYDFLNYRTGRLDPGVATIARNSGVCERTAHAALKQLRSLGLLDWVRRCREDRDERGHYLLRQDTNAYQLANPDHWGQREPAPPPLPTPDVLGYPTHMLDSLEAATMHLAAGQHRAAHAALREDQSDPLALALARLGAAIGII